uniref:Uncharacterized protein n=1 Tax=Leersia perrieri TaxID=77586 RepID=A0A0D9WRG1_9ORYZ
MPVPVHVLPVLVCAMAGVTVLGGFYSFLYRESNERTKSSRKEEWQQNIGVMAIVFGSSFLLQLLAATPSTEASGNNASLLLALSTFLCGTTLTLLTTLPKEEGHRISVLINWRLTFVCVILCVLTSLGLLSPFPRDPYPRHDAAAVGLLVMLVLVVAVSSVYGHLLPKVGLGKKASRFTAGITVVAAGCLIGAAPELSGDAPAPTTTKRAAFFVLCVTIVGLFVTVLSTINAESIDPSTVRKAEGQSSSRLAL